MADDNIRDAVADLVSGAEGVRRLSTETFDNVVDRDEIGDRHCRSEKTAADTENSCFRTKINEKSSNSSVKCRVTGMPPFNDESVVPDSADDHHQMAILSAPSPTPTFAETGVVVMETSADADAEAGDDETTGLPFPGFVDRAFYFFSQTTRPRSWCLQAITWPYPLI